MRELSAKILVSALSSFVETKKFRQYESELRGQAVTVEHSMLKIRRQVSHRPPLSIVNAATNMFVSRSSQTNMEADTYLLVTISSCTDLWVPTEDNRDCHR